MGEEEVGEEESKWVRAWVGWWGGGGDEGISGRERRWGSVGERGGGSEWERGGGGEWERAELRVSRRERSWGSVG